MGWLKNFLYGLSPKSLSPKKASKDTGKSALDKALLENKDISQLSEELTKYKIEKNLKINLQRIRSITGNSVDYVIREFKVGSEQVAAAMVFIDGLANSDIINILIKSLGISSLGITPAYQSGKDIYRAVQENLLPVNALSETDTLKDMLEKVAMGNSALLLEGYNKCFIADTKGWETRSLDEPEAEAVLRGPHDGFIESLRVNTALVRRRIRTPWLWFETLQIGALSQTTVSFAYIKGLAKEKVLEELRSRLKRIDIDGVLESNYLEEFIVDHPYTFFPTVLSTERPDIVCASLLEGRVAIFTDNSPVVLIIPTVFANMMMSPDDYNELNPIGTFIRSLRWFAYLVAMFLPGVYVAVLDFHQELLPTPLLMRIVASREGVPLPVMWEAILMELTFEILREAGVRLPKAIGPAISIVGALVLGDAAIRAGIVSPGIVIIVAFTAIASFTTPTFSLGIAARLLRFVFLLLGGVFGLFGIQFGFFLLLIHLCSLRSFGVPFLSPLSPLITANLTDLVLRWYWWGLIKRPKLIGDREPQRQDKNQMPRPPKQEEEES
ncbi:MAG: spore germination protein [Firmicutes bacterium]|nr:spore germination protein [Bacillota bacterium]